MKPVLVVLFAMWSGQLMRPLTEQFRAGNMAAAAVCFVVAVALHMTCYWIMQLMEKDARMEARP